MVHFCIFFTRWPVYLQQPVALPRAFCGGTVPYFICRQSLAGATRKNGHVIGYAHSAMEQNASPQPNDPTTGQPHNTEQVIPVIEEFVTLHQEVVTTGKVQIKKTVTQEQAFVNLPITNEFYDIERVPVHETRDTPPPPLRYEGDVMIIPVTKEITVIQKRYEVIEELRITRRVTETPFMQEITLMKEHVDVVRHRDSDQAPGQF